MTTTKISHPRHCCTMWTTFFLVSTSLPSSLFFFSPLTRMPPCLFLYLSSVLISVEMFPLMWWHDLLLHRDDYFKFHFFKSCCYTWSFLPQAYYRNFDLWLALSSFILRLKKLLILNFLVWLFTVVITGFLLIFYTWLYFHWDTLFIYLILCTVLIIYFTWMYCSLIENFAVECLVAQSSTSSSPDISISDIWYQSGCYQYNRKLTRDVYSLIDWYNMCQYNI